MKFNVGVLVPVLDGWVMCIDECDEECGFCAELPEWAKDFGDKERIYLGLYLMAKHIMDYRLVAGLHIFGVKNRFALRPEVLVRAYNEAKVKYRIGRRITDECGYAWEAVVYKGLVYASMLLDLDRMVVIKVVPPKDKREREKMRVLLEGKRVTIRGKTYHVGGLIKRLGGEKLSSWVYLVSKRNHVKLVKQVGFERVIVYDCCHIYSF